MASSIWSLRTRLPTPCRCCSTPPPQAPPLAAPLSGAVPGAATPSFAAKQDFPTGITPFSVTVGDVISDGKLDLAAPISMSTPVSVLLNTATPGAATPSFAAKQDFATG